MPDDALVEVDGRDVVQDRSYSDRSVQQGGSSDFLPAQGKAGHQILNTILSLLPVHLGEMGITGRGFRFLVAQNVLDRAQIHAKFQ